MTFEYAFFVVLTFTMIREIFFLRQIQKLLDRAMSRSYHEFQVANGLNKKIALAPKMDDSEAEDLGSLHGIG